jgi:UDP-N-acetylglucosamine--N-acetylmuramyl-(pentapeptide) pyrophosphoryl-undecaprenol N-acetylglucosamine transferase
LYPGIAVAEEVMRRPQGAVLFVGTARGLETKLVPAAGFDLELLQVSGLKGMGWKNRLQGLGRLPRAFAASMGILRRFRPDVVLGVGGYASGPLVLAATLLGYPTAIQEQNSLPGITNRVLGRFVGRVFVAFEDARASFPAAKTELTGNPVRQKFLAATTGVAADERDPLLLVVGGSQGARAVNERVVDALAVLQQRGRLPRLLHQAGANDEARTRERYLAAGLGPALASGRLDVRAYLEDMPACLSAAALVVGRAGALTLAELAIVGRPAVLIPLPTAADDHQTRNAQSFERAGAAVLLRQDEATGERLAEILADLLGASQRRAAMAAASRVLARPDAAPVIVARLEELAAQGGHGKKAA